MHKDHQLTGNKLIFSNKTSEDLILGDDLSMMFGSNFHTVFTIEKVIGFRDRRIDELYLNETIKNFSQYFYVCGPEAFVKDIQSLLINLGAHPEAVVIEK